ncbi:FAD/NAD(P)-binding protein [Brevundimonas sp.]|uniref:FAD/NAD(P)-binding protein n=1 Tax=Brevundimonas sp. TaxID=1871086 RepID=UPI0025BA61CE|nr:FAD/NAD(P)-binding protein [Brevundimonas sp.]
MAEAAYRVAIVGGGFSGAMLAARLAESGIASVLINDTTDVGLGVAYSTAFEGHLLNVRSGRMSAVDGRPDDFVRWLQTHRPELADPIDFAPRKVYGDYVRDRLATVNAGFPGRIETTVGRVAAIEAAAVYLTDGRTIPADAVVLATGNPAPAIASGEAGGRIIGDPWAAGALDRIAADDSILIIGTGLTMVDMIQSLLARGWKGRATALSRRGLLPRAHAATPDLAADLPADALTGPVSNRLAAARATTCASGWRGVMEAYRPITADLWASADADQRARMVRHLRPWWDVHRHRIAPRIAETLTGLVASRRLRVVAGRLGVVEADGDGVWAGWAPRGGGAQPPLTANWLIDCTGPAHSPATDPLTAPLLASGRAQLDPLRLGLDLDPSGRVLDAQGVADPCLFVLGPPARAAFWETIAVPDIRKRIEAVVTALSADVRAPG